MRGKEGREESRGAKEKNEKIQQKERGDMRGHGRICVRCTCMVDDC